MYGRFSREVEFFVVYIREAHPTDAWQVQANERDNVLFKQPTNFDERAELAQACSLRLELKIPTLIDGINDSTDQMYYAMPDRLYLVGRDGLIVYRGGPDPSVLLPTSLNRQSCSIWPSPLARDSCLYGAQGTATH